MLTMVVDIQLGLNQGVGIYIILYSVGNSVSLLMVWLG